MIDPYRYRLPQYISSPRFTMRRLDEPDAKDLFEAAQESHDGLYKWYGGAYAKWVEHICKGGTGQFEVLYAQL
jgi:hypothetical protein